MKRRSLLFTAFCSFFALSMVAPAYRTLADQATKDLTITISESGTFSITLSNDANGSIAQSTSAISSATTVTNIRMRMNITDTKSYRAGFSIWISATPYTSTLQIPYSSPTAYYAFPADALWIYSTRDPQPGRCDYTVTAVANECANTTQASNTTTFPIGNPWALDSSGNRKTPAHPTGGNEAVRWTSNTTPSGNALNTLNVARKVTDFDPGTGTLNSRHSVFLGVTIPPAMPATSYTSVITVTTLPPGP